MNEDAEKWIYANYGIPESGIGMDVALMEQLLQAMRWAYADAAKVVYAKVNTMDRFPEESEFNDGYSACIDDCKEAILERAK